MFWKLHYTLEGRFKEDSCQDCFLSNQRTDINYFLKIINDLKIYFVKNDLEATLLFIPIN